MLVVFLKRRSFLRLECALNVLNSSQQPVRLTASCRRGTGEGGGGMEFISGGNIFLKKILNKPMQRKSDFGGREYCFRKSPLPRVPYVNFVSVLSGV